MDGFIHFDVFIIHRKCNNDDGGTSCYNRFFFHFEKISQDFFFNLSMINKRADPELSILHGFSEAA